MRWHEKILNENEQTWIIKKKHEKTLNEHEYSWICIENMTNHEWTLISMNEHE